ncbi:pentatricopeptide repeat-containing protein At1g62930, chloroplastic-like [Hevea brasiliensis]|uniref:pentatricopeptide repeat-containing protein At1g62930, chloroplastic-like n=1 Tax=Hevea brasiliensis TaxID=3981 RepID=UPI0025CE9AC4|nr:pentatricopeptide repeat-containing protein At1g62930, chloroplastic-like [Hevea brasiliensis]
MSARRIFTTTERFFRFQLQTEIFFTSKPVGLWEARRPGIALEVFKNMCSHGQQPDKVTFSIILDGLCKQGYLDEALTLFKAMEKSRLKPDCVSFTILIDGMCKAGRLNDAKELFFRHFEKGLQPNVYTYSTIIKGLCKEGLLDEAYKVFRGMEKSGCVPNGCCYNVIIQGFLRHEDVAKATQLIDEMVDKGFSADATTFECFSPFFHTGNQCMLWFLSCKHFDLALVLQVQVLVLPYKNKELPLILHMIMTHQPAAENSRPLGAAGAAWGGWGLMGRLGPYGANGQSEKSVLLRLYI